jgi:NlpC/P60 family putative phage cell wall peptidase
MSRVVEAARRWIGTPYVHQASVRGAGADCLGLVRGIWRELFGTEPEPVPPYAADWSEAGREERLWQAAARHLHRLPQGDVGPGEVLLFRMRQAGVAKHLAIASAPDRFIHAYSRHGVIENTLSAPWRRRIVARFAFPFDDRRS